MTTTQQLRLDLDPPFRLNELMVEGYPLGVGMALTKAGIEWRCTGLTYQYPGDWKVGRLRLRERDGYALDDIAAALDRASIPYTRT